MRFELDDLWLEKMERFPALGLVQKRRLYRTIMVCAVGVSYLIDAVLLALFNKAGTVNTGVVLFYLAAGLSHVAIFSILHWSGFSDRVKNPHLTIWQMCYAVTIQVISIGLAPKLTAYFMGVMFVIYAFGMLRISLKEALAIWFFASIAILTALVANFGPTDSPPLWVPNKTESLLVVLSFSLILLRAIGLGYYSTQLRMKMFEKSSLFEKAATHDALTKLFNRDVVLTSIKDHIALSKRNMSTATVGMLDIDNFKEVNDTFGHTVGDIVLARLAHYFEEQMREEDIVGRYGGEEFIFLLPTINTEDAMNAMERMRKGVADMVWTDIHHKIHVTISCGITEISDSDDLDHVICRADSALYLAKRMGRNRVESSARCDERANRIE